MLQPHLPPAATSPRPLLLAEADGTIPEGTPSGGEMPRYVVPGRSSGSRMPWEFFLGHAAHRLIAYAYGVNHVGNKVFYNTATIGDIVVKSRIGRYLSTASQ